MWDLLEGRHLFDTRGQDGHYSAAHHLAEMVALLGPPPPEFIHRSKESEEYWSPDGKPACADDVERMLILKANGGILYKFPDRLLMTL